MIPQVSSTSDIRTVLKFRGRYRPRQRIIALRACKKWLTTQLMAGRIDRAEAIPLRAELLMTLKKEEREFKLRKGETVERPGQQRAIPNATVAARELANSMGVDLSRVSGTGAGGKIIKKDVLDGAQSG